MKGLVQKQDTWHPVTEADPQPDLDPRSQPIEYPSPAAGHNVVLLVDGQRSAFGLTCTKGLEVGELSLTDLTSAELIALSESGGIAP